MKGMRELSVIIIMKGIRIVCNNLKTIGFFHLGNDIKKVVGIQGSNNRLRYYILEYVKKELSEKPARCIHL